MATVIIGRIPSELMRRLLQPHLRRPRLPTPLGRQVHVFPTSANETLNCPLSFFSPPQVNENRVSCSSQKVSKYVTHPAKHTSFFPSEISIKSCFVTAHFPFARNSKSSVGASEMSGTGSISGSVIWIKPMGTGCTKASADILSLRTG